MKFCHGEDVKLRSTSKGQVGFHSERTGKDPPQKALASNHHPSHVVLSYISMKHSKVGSEEVTILSLPNSHL